MTTHGPRPPAPHPPEESRELAARLAEQGVRYAVGAFVDVFGRARGKVVPVELLPGLIAGSEHYTPRGLDGLGQMTADEECHAAPDVSTLRILPTDRRFAVMLADLIHDGRPFDLCGRSILKRQLELAAEHGYRFMLGVESEFYVFAGDGTDPDAPLEPLAPSQNLRPTPAYDLEATLDSMPLLDTLVQALEEMDFGVFSFDHEGGSGQYEFDFAHDDALATCDKLTLLRIVSKQVAKAAGGFATFMPKPASGMWGSGAHFNMSLEAVHDGTNQFVGDTKGQAGLPWTDTCRAFVAGLASHARALAAITCPTVNSYKRLVPSLSAEEISWAPTRATYGENDRACMLRLPRNRPAVENRAVDAAANPYLAAAFSLAAGMDGILRELDPDRVTLNSDGDGLLPRTLKEAVDAFQDDPLVRKTFPANFVDEYVAMKESEWNEYHDTVSTWERRRYLTAF